MRLREATTADAAAIAALYAPFVTDTTVTFEESPPDATEMARRMTDVQAQGLPWLVAEVAADATAAGGDVPTAEPGGGAPAPAALLGYAYATPWRSRRGYRFSVEVTVYVAPASHRQGVGRALYEALFARLADAGYHAAMAGIALPNPASVALHEAMGMQQVAHFRETGRKFGRWVDVGYWERVLAP
ncbi:MAG: GNAT family N-acetyltransferase [Gemmatimonadota bacterium]|jgi:phosphinothricin acetyltransferase|nr:GNAT family N-acetyltransferase [Gemmatimonadota bacterium]MDQ8147818.1 GNAT family N-acetyltransferase [Gemmatimonadota bacterium]MDQ8149579.1 GNAT family N-acetyltransferase [Gemmatimonadota bacterium]MDQ8156018.1 GNAT family N-acetyltransferase [Gemmatimonadota bacterium]MDQ8177141.1 GNAT family N-acetyltransferase [Gemmatimonadota bacterium]